MLQSLILIDTLPCVCLEKKKKKERNSPGLFFQGQTHLAGSAAWNFHGF
jgi:hypothetical protein